jgi:hypothetical protein
MSRVVGIDRIEIPQMYPNSPTSILLPFPREMRPMASPTRLRKIGTLNKRFMNLLLPLFLTQRQVRDDCLQLSEPSFWKERRGEGARRLLSKWLCEGSLNLLM